ncbi:MAG: hypothetical protein J5I65_03180 [Aridibacter famidurans]|nr:hypothetical protein [Aridibacter famidurans]
MRTGFPKYGLKLIRWLGVEIVKINGSYGLKTSYLRQGGSNPPVLVEQYHFENHDRTHTVTVSYRYEDADVWKPAIDTVVDSLRFLVRPN